MKNLMFIILLCISSTVYSQGLELNGKTFNKGEIITDPGLSQFIGTWESVSSNNSFRIKLFKTKIAIGTNQIESISGNYKLLSGKSIEYNSINKSSVPVDFSGSKVKNGVLIFYFKDGKTKVRGNGTLTLSNPNELIWNIGISERGDILSDGSKGKLTVPTKMILKRIN